jgi:thiol-disulfide isomerase/thioredoxin
MKLTLMSYLATISICIAQTNYLSANNTNVASVNDFYKKIHTTNAATKLIVIEFYAPWCGASKETRTLLEAVTAPYKNSVQCLYVDASKDELRDIVDMFGVQGTPTLAYIEKGSKTKDNLMQRLTLFLGKPPTTSANKKPAVPIAKKKQPIKKVTKPAAKKIASPKKTRAKKA